LVGGDPSCESDTAVKRDGAGRRDVHDHELATGTVDRKGRSGDEVLVDSSGEYLVAAGIQHSAGGIYTPSGPNAEWDLRCGLAAQGPGEHVEVVDAGLDSCDPEHGAAVDRYAVRHELRRRGLRRREQDLSGNHAGAEADKFPGVGDADVAVEVR